MEKMVKINWEDNTTLYIKAAELEERNNNKSIALNASASDDKITEKKEAFLDKSLAQVKNFAGKVAKNLKDTKLDLDEFEVEFGIKFTMDAGIFISSVGTETDMKVKIKWKSNKNK